MTTEPTPNRCRIVPVGNGSGLPKATPEQVQTITAAGELGLFLSMGVYGKDVTELTASEADGVIKAMKREDDMMNQRMAAIEAQAERQREDAEARYTRGDY